MPTKKSIKEFIQSIQRNDIPLSEKLLSAHPDLIHATVSSPPKKYDGQSLLQIAFRNGAGQIAINLIEAGAEVNFIETSTINDWNTPVLHDALNASVWTTMNQPETKCELVNRALKLLLYKGADPNSRDSYGSSAYSRLMWQAGRRLDDVYVEGAYKRHTSKVRFIKEAHDMLLEFGAEIEQTDKYGSQFLTEKQMRILGLE